MSLTKAQELAVNKTNTNIIVSAGAGSGKTTVLKTRVSRILKDNDIDISSLLILTFTNNAAAEMKDRIRKILMENPETKEKAKLIDSANITTFDAYAGYIVRKYNYLLDISKNFKIIDSSIINLQIKKIIDDIFENLYKENDNNFCKFIHDLCIKDDEEIKESIAHIYSLLGNITDKKEFLDNYILNYYNKDFINHLFNEYENYLLSIKDEIIILLDNLNEYSSSEIILKNDEITKDFRNAYSYDELVTSWFSRLAISRNGYDEKAKDIKKEISDKKKQLKKYLTESKKDLINHYLNTKDYAEVIINILKELDLKINLFKNEHNSYEFSDISALAIKLVKDNIDIRNEIKNNTFEIMIDEYQDTNDIQEEFISYIANNNVYMVGDIKQSIYRFRNANPYIFKKKYDNYRDGKNGFKIDLNENFRSRNEVVNVINKIFNLIMSDDIGGANYQKEHEMVFGNKKYNELLFDKYDTKILRYKNNNSKYSNVEIESFIIANDILNKINSNETIVDFDAEGSSRKLEYKDIAILIDKSKNFETVKKILESKNIPVAIYKDKNISEENEIYILKNIITILLSIKDNKFDNIFKHAFISVLRSYVGGYSDNEIFDIITNKNYQNNDIYLTCLKLVNKLEAISNKELILSIIEEFNIYDKLLKTNNYEERITNLEYFVNNAEDLNNFGFNIYDLNAYFDEILNKDDGLKMSINLGDNNAVKIMTIHKSKGLEFNYVYLPFLGSNFYKENKNYNLNLTNKYGFIIPFYDKGIGQTFIKDLNSFYENKETLSEKIRLFYVALTRAKEKLILIDEQNDNSCNFVKDIKCYSDILKYSENSLSEYIQNIDLENINLNKDYLLLNDASYLNKITKSNEIINIKKIDINNEILENKHFSHAISSLMTESLRNILDFGTYMHYVFEVYNFKNDNLNELDIPDEYKKYILNFLNHEEVKNIKNAIIYKEKEIKYNKDGNKYHGFIDLLLEYDDHFDIIDYKTSNIDNPDYDSQLNGYKDYIENKYGKTTNIYLYSIKKDIFKKLN